MCSRHYHSLDVAVFKVERSILLKSRFNLQQSLCIWADKSPRHMQLKCEISFIAIGLPVCLTILTGNPVETCDS